MRERWRVAIGRGLLLAVTVVTATSAVASADTAIDDSGDVPLQRVHTGDLGMLIAVDVVVGDARSRWLVDTGATHHLVAPAFAARLALPGRGSTSAATAFGRFAGRQVDLPALGVGALVLPGQRALVLDLIAIAGTAADGVDGVLGAPALAGRVLDLDLRGWTLRLRASPDATCPPEQRPLPVSLHQGLPVVEMRIDDAQPERALLDTGNAGAIVRIDDALAPPRRGVPVPGLPAVAARAATVEFGPLRRLDAPVTYLRSAALRRALAADVGALAGMAVLEGSRLRLDLAGGRLCVEPGERRLAGGFGLAIEEDAGGWFVAAVYDTSPAARAGLRVGDRVRRWNDGAPPASVDAAWAALHGRDELALVVERDGVERALTLRRDWFLPLAR